MNKAVIGLNLCPFAESVVRSASVRYRVSEQRSEAGLLEDLQVELTYLHATPPRDCQTTLLIHPWVLDDFLTFNDFLQVADDAVRALDLEGELQVASFHPRYQFAGTQPDDIDNYTNRSPYPTLHLLREASITAALAKLPDPDSIYQNNIVRLRELGHAGWAALWTERES